MTQSVLLAVEAGIATLSFNRPGVMNAMDAEMMTEFRAAAELVERDPAVRAVVLKGEGKAFIAGGDVALFGESGHMRDLPFRPFLDRDGADATLQRPVDGR